METVEPWNRGTGNVSAGPDAGARSTDTQKARATRTRKKSQKGQSMSNLLKAHLDLAEPVALALAGAGFIVRMRSAQGQRPICATPARKACRNGSTIRPSSQGRLHRLALCRQPCRQTCRAEL